jgi:hypothetical protein
LPWVLPVLAAAGCEILVTFDPIDGAARDEAGADVDGAEGADGDGEVPEAPDEDEGDAGDGDADDGGGLCGNGVVDDREECDGDEPQPCTTGCGTPGTRACVDCRWAACATSTPEQCNDLDEDCDGFTDEDFACRRGTTVDCLTTCGSHGRTVCTDLCTVPAACTPPSEACNGADDDCDTTSDEGFACAAGSTVPCTSICDTTGTGLCTVACAVPPASACTPPAETCNERDDDCDGLTDEGLWSASPTEVRLTATATPSVRPAIAWNGGGREFGVAYEEDEEDPEGGGTIYFTRLTPSGADLMGTDTVVSTEPETTTDGYLHQQPALALAGSEWGFVWSWIDAGASEIYFRRLTAAGTYPPGADEIRITSASRTSAEPSLVWTGTEYGVAWNDARDGNLEVYFTRLSSTGAKPISDIRLTETTSCVSSRPSLAWTGSEFGVAWYDVCSPGDPGDIWFTRVTSAGSEVAGAERGVIVASGSQSSMPRLVWNGTGYGLVWLDDREGAFDQLYFARLNSEGVVAGSLVPLTTPTETSGVHDAPAIVWDADRREYVVAWSDQRNAAEACGSADCGEPGGVCCGTEIYFQRLSESAAKIGDPVRVTWSPGPTWRPWLADYGDGYGIVWADSRHAVGADGNSEVYFNVLRCR